MLLKIALLIVLLAMLISLFVGLFFLFKDQGKKKRLVYALFFRVFFAGLAISIIIYALITGRFQAHSPVGLMPDSTQSTPPNK